MTLLFGLPRYQEVVQVYMTGLEERAASGQPIKHVASVASFFLSRIDTLVDPIFEKILIKMMKCQHLVNKFTGKWR